MHSTPGRRGLSDNNSFTAEAIKLARDNRKWELHIMATRRYKRLWHAKDVDEFKDIFVDCVECHYAAFRRGILHCNLSLDTLMYDDGPKRNGEIERQIGIIFDWDLASLIDDKEDIPSHTEHRTGTIHFLLVELLKKNPSSHKYWNDLELFLYILFWAAVHIDLDKHVVLPTHRLLKSWNHHNLMLQRLGKM